jgi:hypothetical protein
MLSFLISNALIVANAAMGVPPVTLHNSTADRDYQKIVSQAQTLESSGTAQVVLRDNVTVIEAPAIQVASFGSQIAAQSLPASSSSLVAAASKYIGVIWDCTRLVEQSLRDTGHQIGDVGPMGFGGVGTVFYDRSQVQPGDIMMRSGHVAIYAGDGIAIQGGYDGHVAVATDSPSRYSAFVRVN